MTGWLAMLVVAALLPFALFSEPDRASTHTLERPPNYSQPLTSHPRSSLIKGNWPNLESSPLPLKQPLIVGLAAEELPPAIEPTPEPTPMPLYVVPKLTPAIDAVVAAAGFAPEVRPLALAVAWCESRWSPDAVGGAGEAGYFQIHPVNWGRFDQFPNPDPWDPYQNAIVAYQMSSGGVDWSAWSCRPY